MSISFSGYLQTGPAGLTWRCHICGEDRPDASISVHTTDVSSSYGLLAGVVTENVRYCNDKPACIAAAPAYRHCRGPRQ